METEATPAKPGRAILEVSAQMLIELLKGTKPRCYTITQNPIPEDATVFGAQYDSLYDTWLIGLESTEYAPVPEGTVLPRLKALTTTTYYPAE